MANVKEIRTKIGSVQNTQKITSAMEMVAASKMRNVISHMAFAHSEYHHPFLHEREAKRVGYIVVTSDGGLCGGLNINLFKAAIASMREWEDKNIDIDVCAIGKKGIGFFTGLGGNVVSEVSQIGDKPGLSDLIGPIKVMLDAYNDGKIDRLFLVYNRFVNSLTQKPIIESLLPLQEQEEAHEELVKHWDYIYEPDAKPVLDGVFMRYIESLVYQGVVENIACEQSARMVAMKAATDNADDLINELQLIYNKVRQASITQEISEIVGGAAALSS